MAPNNPRSGNGQTHAAQNPVKRSQITAIDTVPMAAYKDALTFGEESMTVYVDDMYKHPMGRFGRMKMSHMIADQEEELHSMAASIGIARKWYQKNHYDVSMSARKKAIVLGAVEVTLKQLAAMNMLRRMGFEMGKPEHAQFSLRLIRGIK